MNVQHLSFHKKKKKVNINKITIQSNSLCYSVIHEINQSTSSLDAS